jgi:hypothetical protein
VAGRWENAAELHWLTRFGHWQEALYDQRISFGRCRSSFAIRVGSPPTSRLAKGFRLVESACNAPDMQLGLVRLDRAFDVLRPGQFRPLPSARGIPDVRDASYLDPALTQIATAVAGKPVEALCWSPRDWRSLAVEEAAVFDDTIDITDLGWAMVGGASINLSPRTCERFEQIVSRDDYELRRDPYYWGWAFTTVTHEAEHARGTENEALTECFAIQQIANAASTSGTRAKPARSWRAPSGPTTTTSCPRIGRIGAATEGPGTSIPSPLTGRRPGVPGRALP